MQRYSQIYFDPLLRDAARKMPSVVQMFNTKLDSFEQGDASVIARVTDNKSGSHKIITAEYSVACDDAESKIIEKLGVDLVGDHNMSYNVNLFFKSNDHDALFNKGKATMQWMFNEEGVWADIVSINGYDLWRLSIMKLPFGTELTKDEVAEYLIKAVGRDFNLKKCYLSYPGHLNV